MIDFDPSKLTRAERGKIAKQARRSVASEIVLILTAGFALAMVTLFFFGKLTFLPLAERLQLRPTLVWVGLAVLTSLIGSFVHGWLATGVVERARKRQLQIHQFDESRKRAETKKKIIDHQETAS